MTDLPPSTPSPHAQDEALPPPAPWTSPIPFNRAATAGRELDYIAEAIEGRHLSGDGPFTKRCDAWLERTIGCAKAFLTHSCTAALEMCAMLLDLGPGDEVIMPSFTFVSTANAVVLRGATPVFVDIRADTLNLDEALIEAAVTPKTRAIFVVHYAGVACAMAEIMAIAERHGLFVVEDAAQGLAADDHGRPLGSIGHLGCLSFHETKNVVSGEGGALLINDPRFIERAHILREKGTNRTKFLEGRVDKYTWVDFGSSYLPSELIAAFLFGQLEHVATITENRLRAWQHYHRRLAPLEREGQLRRPVVPQSCRHNGHIYYLLMNSPAVRNEVLRRTKAVGIGTTFHYIPLHNAPAGLRFARSHGDLPVTVAVSARLLRLPLFPGIAEADLEAVVAVVEAVAAEPT